MSDTNTKKKKNRIMEKVSGVTIGRSHNGRFGVMAAVAPQKRQCKIGRLYPAGSSVGAATTPSRRDVARKSGDSAYGQRQKIRCKFN